MSRITKACSLTVLGLGMLNGTSGCGEPPPMTTMSPPGIERDTLPAEFQERTAKAIGETSLNKPVPIGETETSLEPAPAPKSVASATPLCEPTEPGSPITTESGLRYETLSPGSGATAEHGKEVRVHYTGTLENGEQFDSSRGRGPFEVRLGMGRVIPGWDEGIAGMQVGEVRKLTIPPDLAYGPRQMGSIPPNSTLIFEVELLEVN